MKYFAMHLADLESESFLSASNDQIATWIFLHAFCCKQSNGGTITDADTLPERFWTRHGIDLGVMKTDSPLWGWDGANVTLNFYDHNGQELYQKKVEAGKSYGRGMKNSSPHREENRIEENRGEEITLHMPDASASCPQADVVGELWKIFPKLGKERSSRKKSQDAWAKIKTADRPPLDVVTTALRGWIECDQWKKESGQFVPGLHKWITERKWEDVPSPSKTTQNKPTLEQLMGGRKCVITKSSDIRPSHRDEKAAREFPEPKTKIRHL